MPSSTYCHKNMNMTIKYVPRTWKITMCLNNHMKDENAVGNFQSVSLIGLVFYIPVDQFTRDLFLLACDFPLPRKERQMHTIFKYHYFISKLKKKKQEYNKAGI